MAKDYKAALHEMGAGLKALNEQIGGTASAFNALHKAAMSDGVLSAKHKELIALGIGIRTQCEDCIISHVRSAMKAGATAEEIAETVGVAISMGGGPAVMYGIKALDAAKAFAS